MGVALTVFSRLNAGHRLNARLEKTAGQNCRFLIKRRGRLFGGEVTGTDYK